MQLGWILIATKILFFQLHAFGAKYWIFEAKLFHNLAIRQSQPV